MDCSEGAKEGGGVGFFDTLGADDDAIEGGGVIISHVGSATAGLSFSLMCTSDGGTSGLTGELRTRVDLSAANEEGCLLNLETNGRGAGGEGACRGGSFSWDAARERDFVAPLCDCTGGTGSLKVPFNGECSIAGEVLERDRRDGFWELFDIDATGVGGNNENDGESFGCGELALRGSCSRASILPRAIWSLMDLSRSKVAWRLASSEVAGWGCKRSPNMTLYRSILILGISTLRKGPLN